MALPDQPLSEREGHERFAKLCALFSSGALSHAELAELDQHLSTCESCRTLLADYAGLVRHEMPLLTADHAVEPALGFERVLAQAKASILAELGRPANQVSAPADGRETRRVRAVARLPLQRYGMLLALMLVIGVVGYILGSHQSRSARQEHTTRAVQVAQGSGLQEQLAAAIRAREASDAAVKERDQKLRALSTELNRQLNYVAKLKKLADQGGAENSRQLAALAASQDENAQLKADRDRMAVQLQEAQLRLTALNREVGDLQMKKVAGLQQNAEMQKRIDDLTSQVKTSQAAISRSARLLASDRDVRELMGARDLLIADVFDVDQNGHNRAPFGRVFYTRNRSLIFYAFDLDQQPGIRNANLRNASTFQAWGTRTADQSTRHAVSLGILYVDSTEDRRWVLKVDNPKVLEQIDAVFVTAEPSGGSDKPQGKQFLYAYLRGKPNHP